MLSKVSIFLTFSDENLGINVNPVNISSNNGSSSNNNSNKGNNDPNTSGHSNNSTNSGYSSNNSRSSGRNSLKNVNNRSDRNDRGNRDFQSKKSYPRRRKDDPLSHAGKIRLSWFNNFTLSSLRKILNTGKRYIVFLQVLNSRQNLHFYHLFTGKKKI